MSICVFGILYFVYNELSYLTCFFKYFLIFIFY